MRGLRLYECAQLMVPGGVGLLVGSPALPPWSATLPYAAAYFLHLFFTYTYNDYAEFERDLENPRKGPLDRRRLGQLAAVAFGLWLVALAALPLRLVVLFAVFQLAAVLYSHPRTLWKGRAPLGELLHALTGGGYFVAGCWVDRLHGDPIVWAGGVAFAALYVSGSCFGQLRDREADARAGLRTLAVCAGPRVARRLGLGLQVVALAALVPLAGAGWAVAVLALGLALPLTALVSGERMLPTRRFQRAYRAGFAAVVAAVALSSWQPGSEAADRDPEWAAARRGLAYLEASQDGDGSWPAYRARRPDLSEAAEYPARVFPVMHVVVTLAGAPAVSTRMLENAKGFLIRQREAGPFWSVDGSTHPAALDLGGEPCWLEPDVETTALGLALFADRLGLGPDDLAAARSRFERYRAPGGLYYTYLDDFYGARGCVAYDHERTPSLGSNLHVLGWLEGAGLPAPGLLEAIERAMSTDRYWESAVYYRSLPILAHLASNAARLGSDSAEGLLARLLGDQQASGSAGLAASPTELAAFVKARAHLCALRADPCPEARAQGRTLIELQRADGSWAAGSIYQVELTRGFFERVIYPRVREATLEQFGVAATLEEALAHAELGSFHFGSPAETTALAVRALLDLHALPVGPKG